MRPFSHVGFLVLLLGGAPLCSSESVAEGSFERTLAVSGAVDLDVNTGAGSIQVRRGDSVTVRVIGTVRVRRLSRSEADEKVRSITSWMRSRSVGLSAQSSYSLSTVSRYRPGRGSGWKSRSTSSTGSGRLTR